MAAEQDLEGGLFDHYVRSGTRGRVTSITRGYMVETYSVEFGEGGPSGGPATVGFLTAELLSGVTAELTPGLARVP